MSTTPHNKQHGMALILALFVVVLVTTVVVSVSWRFQLSMARNENRWHGAQARAYLEGSEQLAGKILVEDLKLTPEVDFLGDLWAQTGEPLPTDEGWVRGKIEDAHSRFNLNSLLDTRKTAEKQKQRYTSAQLNFMRFLQLIELETGPIQADIASGIMDALQDWLDGDSNPSGYEGAEKSYYDGLDPPINITNAEMSSVSELLLVKGVTPEIYRALLPFIIALPKDVKMNINTVKPEILRSFNRKDEPMPLNEADWLLLVEERKLATEGYANAKDFANTPVVKSILGDSNDFDTNEFVVKSDYFLFFSETLVGEQVRRGKTLLLRENGQVRVLRRTDANF